MLNEHVPTKMTGILKPHKVGQVKFIGRVICRENGVETVVCCVTPTYLDSCFSDFGLGKLKVGKLVIPNLRQTLDQDPGAGKEFQNSLRRAMLGIVDVWGNLHGWLKHERIYMCL